MGKKLKAVALSALVLPGLGQLVMGRKVKGGVMILLDNFFILGGLFIALRSTGKLLLAGKTGMDPEKLLASIRVDTPYATWVGAGFLLLWVYSVVDVLTDKGDDQG